MATVSSNEIESTFRFTVNAKDLEKSKSVSTAKFEVSNSKWRVRFSRESINSNMLAIHLENVSLKKPWIFSKNRKEWSRSSREAQATFKLLQPDGRAIKPIVKHLSIKTFDSKYFSHGVDDFIEWGAFLNDYTRGNLATFEINISPAPLQLERHTKVKMMPVSAKMIVVIRGAKKMAFTGYPKTTAQGICWDVIVQKFNEHLSVNMIAIKEDMDDNWYYKAVVKIALISSVPDSKSVSCNIVVDCVKGETNYAVNEFLKWSDFVDESKGYIDDMNKAKLSIEIQVDGPQPLWKLQSTSALTTDSSFECIASPS